MKIVIDKHIPFFKGVFDDICDVLYVDTNAIDSNTIKDAECLIVRTRTKCNRELLVNSNIRLIASATAGYEHIDIDFCTKNDIKVFVAKGCNASSVAQYIASVLSYWVRVKKIDIAATTLGIVGYGFVGKQVEKIAGYMGFRCLLCDPPLHELNENYPFVSLDEIAQLCDIITFHTPLTEYGKHATKHLANRIFFDKCVRKPLIINAARGGIVEETSMLEAYKNKKISAFSIDCWENEPHISLEVLEKSLIATPHIAGYSIEGKMQATNMCISAIKDFFDIKLPVEAVTKHRLSTNNRGVVLAEELLKNYNITTDSNKLKADYQCFEHHRNNYGYRNELGIL